MLDEKYFLILIVFSQNFYIGRLQVEIDQYSKKFNFFYNAEIYDCKGLFGEKCYNTRRFLQ